MEIKQLMDRSNAIACTSKLYAGRDFKQRLDSNSINPDTECTELSQSIHAQRRHEIWYYILT
jgi:hypothetical protein